MSFLKRHDTFGFLDNSLLFPDGMSGFCIITLYKWRSPSEISQISLLVCKSQPETWDISLPGVQKSVPNLEHTIAWGA